MVNMWCAHTLMLTNAMKTVAPTIMGVSENRLSRKHWNDLRDEPEGWQDQNVNFGMSEDPEEVHPQRGGSACLRIEEVSSKVAIHEQH